MILRFHVTLLYLTILKVGLSLASCTEPGLSECTCDYIQLTFTCVSTSYTSIPTDVPSNAVKLFFISNTAITSVEDNSLSGLTSLTELEDSNRIQCQLTRRLSRNKISSISANAFKDLTLVKTIYLDSNKLQSLPAGLFAMNTNLIDLKVQDNLLTSFSADLFLPSTGIIQIQINNNPLTCCGMGDFISWIGSQSSLSDVAANCDDYSTQQFLVDIALFDNSNCSAVNGQWGEWSSASCSVTCGTGSIARSRICNNPEPSNGGLDCTGSSTDAMPCSLETCNNDNGTNETDSDTFSDVAPLVAGLVVGVSVVIGGIALVTIIYAKKAATPKVQNMNKGSIEKTWS